MNKTINNNYMLSACLFAAMLTIPIASLFAGPKASWSCNMNGGLLCLDYQNSGYTRQGAQKSCAKAKGVFASSPCPGTGKVGTCLVARQGKKIHANFYYKKAKVAKATCKLMKGAWKAK